VTEIDNSEERRTVLAVVTIEFSCASKYIAQLGVIKIIQAKQPVYRLPQIRAKCILYCLTN